MVSPLHVFLAYMDEVLVLLLVMMLVVVVVSITAAAVACAVASFCHPLCQQSPKADTEESPQLLLNIAPILLAAVVPTH
jgi:hypothetical protein